MSELRHLKSEAREATKLLEDKKVLEVKVSLLCFWGGGVAGSCVQLHASVWRTLGHAVLALLPRLHSPVVMAWAWPDLAPHP